jgi:predicted DNA-binding transcriptional regulator AlpA
LLNYPHKRGDKTILTQEDIRTAQQFLETASCLGKLSQESVNEILSSIHSQTGKSEDKQVFLTKKETAKLLNCSVRQIDILTSKGKLKKRYIGPSSPRFVKDEIIKFMYRRKI